MIMSQDKIPQNLIPIKAIILWKGLDKNGTTKFSTERESILVLLP